MALVKNTEHDAQALANLIEQFKDKENIRKLLSIYVDQIQQLEDALFEIIGSKDLSTATGQQLDDIGALVGESRSGRDDTDYRSAIELRILINGSDGSIEDLIEIMVKFDGTLSFTLVEGFPASISTTITTAVPPSFDPSQLQGLIMTSRAGGVGSRLFYFAAVPFQYDTAGGEYDVGLYATSVAA